MKIKIIPIFFNALCTIIVLFIYHICFDMIDKLLYDKYVSVLGESLATDLHMLVIENPSIDAALSFFILLQGGIIILFTFKAKPTISHLFIIAILMIYVYTTNYGNGLCCSRTILLVFFSFLLGFDIYKGWHYNKDKIFKVIRNAIPKVIIDDILIVKNIFNSIPSDKQYTTVNNKGYLYNNTDNERLDSFRKNYAETIIEGIKNTNTADTTFAIGINSAWGTGKTTFLNELKQKFDDNKYTTIEFNAWNCKSADDIDASFFKLLSKNLNFEESYMQKLLASYLKEKNNSYGGVFSEFIDSIRNFFGIYDQRNYKSEIDRILKMRKIPIIVLIDDIDRMNKEEILAVFRLIRNTANFKNIVFIAAYDLQYLKKTIGDDELSSNYLKKIFSLEVTLPRVNTNSIPTYLQKVLSEKIDNNETNAKLTDIIDSLAKGANTLEAYLKNYRDVDRFTNLFMTDYLTISKTKGLNINIRDFFLLELLHYADIIVYTMLRDNYPSLLYIDQSKSNIPVFSLLNEEEHKTGAFSQLSQHTKLVLEMLFEKTEPTIDALRDYNNYWSYFCFGAANGAITDDDYNAFMDSSEDNAEAVLLRLKYNNKVGGLITRLCNENNADEKRKLTIFSKLLLIAKHVSYKQAGAIFISLFPDYNNRKINDNWPMTNIFVGLNEGVLIFKNKIDIKTLITYQRFATYIYAYGRKDPSVDAKSNLTMNHIRGLSNQIYNNMFSLIGEKDHIAKDFWNKTSPYRTLYDAATYIPESQDEAIEPLLQAQTITLLNKRGTNPKDEVLRLYSNTNTFQRSATPTFNFKKDFPSAHLFSELYHSCYDHIIGEEEANKDIQSLLTHTDI